MATKIQICNGGLRILGAARITALTDSTESARILTDVYDMIQDEVLVSHPWNFAIKRVALVELDDAPTFKYAHAFQLPADCLRVIRMEDDEDIFERESDTLVTDEGTAKIKYIARITDTTKYTPAFVTTFSQRLAAEIAYPLTQSTTITEAMYKLYLSKLSTAKGIDAQEGTGQKIEEQSWEEARG